MLLATLATSACGFRGAPPAPSHEAPVSNMRVEARAGAARVSWQGRPEAADPDVRTFDVLRRQEVEGKRTFFETVASLRADGTHRYYFLDLTLTPGETYTYRVRPRRAAGASVGSLPYSGPEGSIAWKEPPPPPDDVQGKALHLSARLTWSPVEGATGYRVYQLAPDGQPFPEPAHRGVLDQPTWMAIGLQNGVPIRYVVRSLRGTAPARPVTTTDPDGTPGGGANDTPPAAPSAAEVSAAAGQGIPIPPQEIPAALRRAGQELLGEGPLAGYESLSSAPVEVTPGLTAPAPEPKLVKAAVTSQGNAVSWRPSSGEQVVGYVVYRRTLEGRRRKPGEWTRRTEEPVVATSWLDEDVKKGVTYEYQVRAVDAAGTEGKPSTPSEPVRYAP